MFLQLLTGLSVLKVVLGARSCDRQYTLSSGTVTSQTSGYYSNNQNCQYDIQVNFGKGIKLTWSTFDIKGYMPNCNDDYVEIFIGCGQHSIGRYCNQNENNLNKPFDVYSPDNCLLIKFHSDGSTNGRGFKAYYSAISLTAGTTGVGGYCSSISTTRSSSYGVISSQSWPRSYPSLKDCYWKIDVGRYKNIKIAFMDVNLEYDNGCDNDKVKVKGGQNYDSYDRSKTIKDSMCGNKNPFYFTSTKERIWIRFKSNSFTAGRGFVAGYVMYDTSSGSGGSSGGGGSSIAGIVVAIIVVCVIAACIYYIFVYRRRAARRAQQQAVVASVSVPSQQVTVQNVQNVHPPPPPQPGYGPPPQQGYAPPPQQGYAPPPQPGYGLPPGAGYGPPPQPGYAPPPYSQVAAAPYPQQGGVSPYPPGQPGGVLPYPPGQPGAAPPYPPGTAPPYPPGAAPYPSAPGSSAPPYPPESGGGSAPYPPQ